MSSRLLVRTKTTVSGNTSGPRDLQLRAALVAQGFVISGHGATSRASAHAGEHATGRAGSRPARPAKARGTIGRIIDTTRAAWKKARGGTATRLPINMPATESRPIRRPAWSAVSHDIDGQDIKTLLRSLGFADSEFRIHMEFQRGWGCM